MSEQTVGIEAIGAYCGVASITVRELFQGRGLDETRRGNLMMRQRSVQMPWEDPVTNAVNAARPVLDRLSPAERDSIGLLITATESGLDYSKSIASYVHKYLGLSRHCRTLEVKQACYGATGALQLATGYLAAGQDPGAKALIIATDVNPMDEHAKYAEPTTGHGAVAVLVGEQPDILVMDRGAYGAYAFEVMDTARPTPDFDLYNADLSLLSYLECLDEAFDAYARRVGPGVSFVDSFDYLAMHTPFAGLVRGAHRKMMRQFTKYSPEEIGADFERRVAGSLVYMQDTGNLCSGSLYLALAGLAAAADPGDTERTRVGLFSYGSGCCSEFYSGVLGPRAHARITEMDISGALERRRQLPFAEYADLVPISRDSLVPRRKHHVDFSAWERTIASTSSSRPPLLVLERVEEYHRAYAWR
ncbi:hydroxymethylglutaryl-CoA synthase family protein [Streptomyces sp. NPDC020965]|uniref:hydroxymethylglutaryl-CoA synthase family protein n=1 Tax=Streptomyces sp. NPDC020965 TaxID=3365105 RepID=UPI0037A5A600